MGGNLLNGKLLLSKLCIESIHDNCLMYKELDFLYMIRIMYFIHIPFRNPHYCNVHFDKVYVVNYGTYRE